MPEQVDSREGAVPRRLPRGPGGRARQETPDPTILRRRLAWAELDIGPVHLVAVELQLNMAVVLRQDQTGGGGSIQFLLISGLDSVTLSPPPPPFLVPFYGGVAALLVPLIFDPRICFQVIL